MEKYLSHYTAARHWNIPKLNVVFGEKEEEEGEGGEGGKVEHKAWCKPEAQQNHYTFLHVEDLVYRRDFISHLTTLPLPKGAMVSAGKMKVASPELTFFQLADVLNIHQLILLGLQLCSYSAGQPSEAISSKQKLKNFSKKAQGMRGYRKACRAIKYIENGSASVMESLAYMVLALPHALGGYGLGRPVFNYEIILKEEGRQRLNKNRCFLDIYYKEARLGVEYDSTAHHSSAWEQVQDNLRAGALEAQGITIMSMTTFQLHNPAACRDFANNLARRLSRRIRIRTIKFEAAHRQLRQLISDA